MKRFDELPQYGRRLQQEERMQAVVIERYGEADELQLADVPCPEVRRRHVLVQVQHIGVNPKDVMVRKGKFATLTGRKFPLILGHDIAGRVVETGGGCDLQIGDRVYGMVNDMSGRAYSQYVSVHIDQIARMPKHLESSLAAAVPLAAQTALQALRDDGDVRPGHRVLINGASGGVGTFAVQIAKILGAHVTAVSSERNAALVAELGADDHIDYNDEDLAALGRKFDTFFDVFGNYDFARVQHMLSARGRYVHTIPSARILRQVATSSVRRKKAKLVVVRSKRSQLDWLSGHLHANRLRPIVQEVLDFEDAKEAHRLLETKRTRGKLVLKVF